MNRRMALYGVAALATAGCGATSVLSPTKAKDQVCFSLQHLRDLHATARTLYVRIWAKIEAAASMGRITPGEFASAKVINDEVKALDFQLQRALDNPGVTVDWDKVMRMFELIARLTL